MSKVFFFSYFISSEFISKKEAEYLFDVVEVYGLDDNNVEALIEEDGDLNSFDRFITRRDYCIYCAKCRKRIGFLEQVSIITDGSLTYELLCGDYTNWFYHHSCFVEVYGHE